MLKREFIFSQSFTLSASREPDRRSPRTKFRCICSASRCTMQRRNSDSCRRRYSFAPGCVLLAFNNCCGCCRRVDCWYGDKGVDTFADNWKCYTSSPLAILVHLPCRYFSLCVLSTHTHLTEKFTCNNACDIACSLSSRKLNRYVARANAHT